MRCPVCHRQFTPDQSDALPFCSRRCREIDLGRWLNEQYSVPHVPSLDELDDLDEDENGAPAEDEEE